MATRPNIVDAIAEGLTLSLRLKPADAADRETLAQAIFDRLAEQIEGADDAHVDAHGKVLVIGEEDIDFTPGGDLAFAELVEMVTHGTAGQFFYHTPGSVDLMLDFGLQEVRIA